MIVEAAVNAVFGGGEGGWWSGVGFAAVDSIASVEVVGGWEGEGLVVTAVVAAAGFGRGGHC